MTGSEICRARAKTCLALAEKEALLHVRQKYLFAAGRWLALCEQAHRVERRRAAGLSTGMH